jgi:catechol 2,3-dioxygenase-like lactoylglutathione lyase family enzyme
MEVEMAAPPIQGIVETCLYVDDLEEARTFFEDVLALRLLMASEGMCVFAAGTCQNLLVFRRGWCENDKPDPGGMIPGHHGEGPAHMAFHVAIGDYDAWKAFLVDRGIPIVSEVTFDKGGRSLYFNDPAGNVLELATPGHWANF